MGLVIGKTPTVEDAVEVVLYHDGKEQVKPNKDGSPPLREDGQEYERITTWLIPMVGGVQRRIADTMMVLDNRSNRSNVLTGSSMMERMIHCVLQVEGIETARGALLKKITQKDYDLLPSWYINAISKKIAEMSGDEEDEESAAGE